MSDPLRTDGSRAQDDASAADRDAKIEQLLLVGLDHYFAARYELAINVWTRALFLDRSHARARAYIERARSALAERQRESEELLQNGVAAFDRGEGDEARRLLREAIERGAPSEEALAVLERLNRLETAASTTSSAPTGPTQRRRAPRTGAGSTSSIGATIAISAFAIGVLGLGGWATWTNRNRIDWRSLVALGRSVWRVDAPAATNAPPIARDASLPLPRRGEETLTRARSLAASGHLREALSSLDAIRPTDLQRADADRLRGDIQRQLLALTSLPATAVPDREKAERRNP
jgi:tetratricopeptide (TPR) repeat protein